MRLTRNETPDGKCKYALVRLDKLRKLSEDDRLIAESAAQMLVKMGLLEYGEPGSEDEFFAIKLKDINAPGGLEGYAIRASATDAELSKDVMELAGRAMGHPHRKQPD